MLNYIMIHKHMGIKLLLFLPFFEIFLFILFGDVLGIFKTFIIIIVSGLIGLWLLSPNKRNLSIQQITLEPLDWLCKRLAGICLIIPCFFTDFLGIMLLFKPLRKLIWSFMPNSLRNFMNSSNLNREKKKEYNSKIIDADYKDLDEK